MTCVFHIPPDGRRYPVSIRLVDDRRWLNVFGQAQVDFDDHCLHYLQDSPPPWSGIQTVNAPSIRSQAVAVALIVDGAPHFGFVYSEGTPRQIGMMSMVQINFETRES